MCEDVKIQLSDKIEQIISKNLDEKSEKELIRYESCKKCRFHEKPWVWGSKLWCCCYDSDNVLTSRNPDELYNKCPINHELEVNINYIKRYGIIHHKPDDDYCYRGSINIVDFEDTHFESDGYNPSVEWEVIASFYYTDEDEVDRVMDLALEYYNRFNLDKKYVKKRCYG